MTAGSRNANVVRGVRDAVQLRQHLDRGALQRGLLVGRGVVEPVVAEGVGHHVRRHGAVEPAHQEERRAEHVAGRLDQPDRRAPGSRPARRRAASRRTGPGAGRPGRPARPRRPARPGRRTPSWCARPSSVAVIASSTVSLDMPLVWMPSCSVTAGSEPAGSTVASHSSSRARTWPGRGWSAAGKSRRGGGACVTPSGCRTCSSLSTCTSHAGWAWVGQRPWSAGCSCGPEMPQCVQVSTRTRRSSGSVRAVRRPRAASG